MNAQASERMKAQRCGEDPWAVPSDAGPPAVGGGGNRLACQTGNVTSEMNLLKARAFPKITLPALYCK